jgi:hypothetical protein
MNIAALRTYYLKGIYSISELFLSKNVGLMEWNARGERIIGSVYA